MYMVYLHNTTIVISYKNKSWMKKMKNAQNKTFYHKTFMHVIPPFPSGHKVFELKHDGLYFLPCFACDKQNLKKKQSSIWQWETKLKIKLIYFTNKYITKKMLHSLCSKLNYINVIYSFNIFKVQMKILMTWKITT